MIIYTVKSGDTVYGIAQKYGVGTEQLIRINNLTEPNKLLIGQSLIIPSEYRSYFVENGDSIFSIARNYSVSEQDIIRINSLSFPYTIYPGMELLIPRSNEPKRIIETNGYAYTDISEQTIRNLSPYLTYMSIFSYKINADGGLNSINDDRIISICKQNGIAPIMVCTNTTEGGGFSEDTISIVLNDNSIKTTLINNIIDTAMRKGYRGVNIDFEYIPPEDKGNYNSFLSQLYGTASSKGLIISTAVAPKIKANQSGLLYEAHDYQAHGNNTDYVIVMTYEWGYLYGPPMAVSPLNEIEKVLRYAVSEIDSTSLMMSLPNYGYDWTLPYRRGRAATVLNLNQAFSLALSQNAEIQFNETSATPFFEYSKDGESHIVWFDDAKSFYLKSELISKYNLLGVSFWSVNSFYPQMWEVISDMYNIKKLL